MSDAARAATLSGARGTRLEEQGKREEQLLCFILLTPQPEELEREGKAMWSMGETRQGLKRAGEGVCLQLAPLGAPGAQPLAQRLLPKVAGGQELASFRLIAPGGSHRAPPPTTVWGAYP